MIKKITFISILIIISFASCDYDTSNNIAGGIGKLTVYAIEGLIVYLLLIRPFIKKRKK